MDDYGKRAFDAASAHVEACESALICTMDEPDPPPSPASNLYCGCNDCIIREALHAAWPILVEGIKEELRCGSVT